MVKVKDVMTKDVISVTPETEIAQAARLLLEKHINGVPVIDVQGNLKGILCQSDLIAQQKKIPLPSFFTFLDGYISLTSEKQFEKQVQKVAGATVADVMTPDPVTVTPETDITDTAALMVDKNYHTLPVVDQGKLVGILGKEDMLRTIIADSKQDNS